MMISEETMPSARVAGLWRYPVKSLLGEQQGYLDLDERGVLGDRLYAVRTAEGKFGSGKSTRRFRQIDGLFGFSATYDAAVPVITFPDGRTMRGDDPAINTALSATLGQPVTIAREAEVSHFDAAPIHLLTTASLAWLRERLPAAAIDERRFRPNILLHLPGAEQIEQSWHGQTLAIGHTVRLRVHAATERCAMVSFAQSDLPKDPTILRCITHDSDLLFGVYADVIVPGRIGAGDEVRVVEL